MKRQPTQITRICLTLRVQVAGLAGYAHGAVQLEGSFEVRWSHPYVSHTKTYSRLFVLVAEVRLLKEWQCDGVLGDDEPLLEIAEPYPCERRHRGDSEG